MAHSLVASADESSAVFSVHLKNSYNKQHLNTTVIKYSMEEQSSIFTALKQNSNKKKYMYFLGYMSE